MKTTAIFVLSFTIIITLAAGSAFGKYSGGTGEPNAPYLIATAANMNQIGAEPSDWGSYFLLVNRNTV
jgi:hypothetical protein